MTFVRDWLQVFPQEQFHFVKLEDYSLNKEAELTHIFNFLGLESIHKADQTRRKNQAKGDQADTDMLPKTRKLLRKFYSPYNKELQQVLNDPRFSWGY